MQESLHPRGRGGMDIWGGGRTLYLTKEAAVVLDSSGQAVTTWSGAKLTGQQHHAIPKTVWKQLQTNPNLKGKYQPRDPRFVTRARDLNAHKGYQRWHRDLDREVTDWLRRNRDATPGQFENFLRNRYQQSDLLDRFPEGLP